VRPRFQDFGESLGFGKRFHGRAETENADLLGDAGAEKIERNVRGAVHEQNLRHGVLKKTPGIIERGDNARWFEEFGDIACAGGGVVTDGDELDFTGGAERYNSGKPVMLERVEAENGEAEGHGQRQNRGTNDEAMRK